MLVPLLWLKGDALQTEAETVALCSRPARKQYAGYYDPGHQRLCAEAGNECGVSVTISLVCEDTRLRTCRWRSLLGAGGRRVTWAECVRAWTSPPSQRSPHHTPPHTPPPLCPDAVPHACSLLWRGAVPSPSLSLSGSGVQVSAEEEVRPQFPLKVSSKWKHRCSITSGAALEGGDLVTSDRFKTPVPPLIRFPELQF